MQRLAGVLLHVRARDADALVGRRRRRQPMSRRAACTTSGARTARSGSPSADPDRSSACARTRSARQSAQPTRQAEPDRHLQGAVVQHRQHAGHRRASTASAWVVGRGAVLRRRRRRKSSLAVRQLAVHFQTDDNFPDIVPVASRAASSSYACALGRLRGGQSVRLLVLVRGVEQRAPRRRNCPSAACRPAGRRRKPQGRLIAGMPARLAAIV